MDLTMEFIILTEPFIAKMHLIPQVHKTYSTVFIYLQADP